MVLLGNPLLFYTGVWLVQCVKISLLGYCLSESHHLDFIKEQPCSVNASRSQKSYQKTVQC